MKRRCKQVGTRESRKTFKGEATWTYCSKTFCKIKIHPCQPEEEEEEGEQEVEDFSEDEEEKREEAARLTEAREDSLRVNTLQRQLLSKLTFHFTVHFISLRFISFLHYLSFYYCL